MDTPNVETGSMFAGALKRDEDMDITQLVRGGAISSNTEPVPATTSETKDNESNDSPVETEILGPGTLPVVKKPSSPVSTQKLSPLQQMKADKAASQRGMVVSNEEYEKGLEKTEKKNIAFNDTRVAAINERLEDMDDTMKKRKAIILIKRPVTSQEYTQMMVEIDQVEFDEDGKASLNVVDQNGNPAEPVWIRLRTETDPTFEEEMALAAKAKQSESEINENVEKSIITDPDGNIHINPLTNQAAINTIQVIIDKTGMGTDFMFSEEEKQKLVEAEEIRLKEVEEVSVPTRIVRKDEILPIQKEVHEYSVLNSGTTICFPASGFRAQMRGLSYGEMADLTLSMDTVTVDQYYKRMTVIYNSMYNISTGPFKDFDTFLKNFAYSDIPIALYGSFVATQPEINQIQLRCNKEECKNTFNWKYASRSVLRLEKCSPRFLEKMKELASAPPARYPDIYKKAAVRNVKVFRMPDTKYEIAIGEISAYEFVYNVIPIMNEDTFRNAFGDDPNGVYINNSYLLMCVPAIYEPLPDGSSIMYTGYKDILDTLYKFSPREIQYVNAIAKKVINQYRSGFSFGTVTCPHCQTVTHDLDIDMDDLVFQMYQRWTNTEIDVSNILNL